MSGGAAPARSVTIFKYGKGSAGGGGGGGEGRPSKQNSASKSMSKHSPVMVTVTEVTADASVATLGVRAYLQGSQAAWAAEEMRGITCRRIADADAAILRRKRGLVVLR